MRKSEAELLCENLERQYGEEWDLTVVNLNRIGLRVPRNEHPYFVAGTPSESNRNEEEEDRKKKVVKRKSKVVVWDNQEGGWTVHRSYRRITKRSQQRKTDLYIFDTRERSFVPVDQFRIPPESS